MRSAPISSSGRAYDPEKNSLPATVKEQWEAWQAAPEGYIDSPELFAPDPLTGGKGLNDPAPVDTLVKNGAAAIDCLATVGTRDVVSATEIAQPGSFSWLVVDQKMVDASSVIQGYISRNLMISGETYEELAENPDIPADAFAAAMAK